MMERKEFYGVVTASVLAVMATAIFVPNQVVDSRLQAIGERIDNLVESQNALTTNINEKFELQSNKLDLTLDKINNSSSTLEDLLENARLINSDLNEKLSNVKLAEINKLNSEIKNINKTILDIDNDRKFLRMGQTMSLGLIRKLQKNIRPSIITNHEDLKRYLSKMNIDENTLVAIKFKSDLDKFGSTIVFTGADSENINKFIDGAPK